jgi:prevent-host-death family protein
MHDILPVQDIKRRGMSAVDQGLREHGSVVVVRNNRPAYVVLSPADYEELARTADQARLSQALEDWREGRWKRTSAAKLMAEAEADE